MIKVVALFASWIVGGIVGVVIAFYAFIGFFSWVFTDPFNWIVDTPPEPAPVQRNYEEMPGWKECVEKGGVPIKSIGNWYIKRCEFPNTQN